MGYVFIPYETFEKILFLVYWLSACNLFIVCIMTNYANRVFDDVHHFFDYSGNLSIRDDTLFNRRKIVILKMVTRYPQMMSNLWSRFLYYSIVFIVIVALSTFFIILPINVLSPELISISYDTSQCIGEIVFSLFVIWISILLCVCVSQAIYGGMTEFSSGWRYNTSTLVDGTVIKNKKSGVTVGEHILSYLDSKVD